MASSITAAMLYDMVLCPHRVSMDVHGKQGDRDACTPLLPALWRRCTAREADLARACNPSLVDLSRLEGPACVQATREAIAAGKPLIYRGCIEQEDLWSRPGLLRLDDDGYVAGDIRSASAEDGAESARKPRRSYAMQLALHTDILERMDVSAGRYGFVLDGRGEETTYELDAPRGPQTTLTLWQEYLKALALVRAIVAHRDGSRPALSAVCPLCHWRTACLRRLKRDDDLSLLPEVGRSVRDALVPHFATVKALAATDPEDLADAAHAIEGVGAAMLRRLHDRARLASGRNPVPFRRAEIVLPEGSAEVFFDVEVDPLRDHCYLHGFLERADGKKPRYRAFFAADASEEAEEDAFAQAWQYLNGLDDAVIYHYGTLERSAWRSLQERYPQVCDADDLETLFSAPTTVDLFASVVRPRTEWPTRDYSAMSIAGFLGFERREESVPVVSAAQWYEAWLERKDKSVKTRILASNEDDCRAAARVLDAVRDLQPGDEV